MWLPLTPKPHGKLGMEEKETNHHFVKVCTFSLVVAQRSTSYDEHLLSFTKRMIGNSKGKR